ncbi:hypothetical protein [Planotetraspora kaengkrachanensis]|uniref:DUF4232 domain-containing protein n=1 Tax=Planotetraspora kaengkrachanensis TaxID=575193 RepID=A0A8J3PYW2_9ACTN|nr:hypothetical protein [Planotetraspora kaengkrachanensis]GIG83659.1 hypothetical protein Pka01_67860 [Planotetraspora kaengkrachanensis]
MDPDTFRGDVGVEGGDVYWRRRVAVLTGMLVVVAVVAWACSSASGKPESPTGVKATPGAGESMVVSLPSPLGSKSPGPSSTALVPGGRLPSASATPSARAAAGSRRSGGPCDAKDLVVALQAGQDYYNKGVTPSFMLTIVNTARVACTVDVGPRMLEMRVTSGSDRIWSTADCVSGPGVDTQTLQRGVPYVRTILWDRRLSGSDCASRRSSAVPGTYVASAFAGPLRSPKVVFHLR